jgi:hypothetical protein
MIEKEFKVTADVSTTLAFQPFLARNPTEWRSETVPGTPNIENIQKQAPADRVQA